MLTFVLTFAVILLVFIVIVMRQPNEFRVSRSITMAAPPEAPFREVNDFHRWEAWSPWAKLDPNCETLFEGPDAGTGAILRWNGDRRVGQGAMTITASEPAHRIGIRLDFLKPFKGTSHAEFTFVPEESNTVVTWSITGKNGFMGKAMGLIMNCEKMISGMYDKGLSSMKAVVEGAPRS